MDVKEFNLKNFAIFLKNNNIISVSISFVIAGMVKEIILKLTNTVILPVIKSKSLKKLKEVNFNIFFVLLLNLIIVSYLLFVLDKSINLSIKNTITI